MDNRIPPLITPFAILSISLALGATNVVVNKVTSTNEGTPTTTQTTNQKNTSNKIFGTPKKKSDSDAEKEKAKAKESSEKAAKESSEKKAAEESKKASSAKEESNNTDTTTDDTDTNQTTGTKNRQLVLLVARVIPINQQQPVAPLIRVILRRIMMTTLRQAQRIIMPTPQLAVQPRATPVAILAQQLREIQPPRRMVKGVINNV
ncbi:hypothetical protein QUF07_03645 [Lentilactobacillus sp. TOM.63]|uniref:hypothetical protein n=1 Tax=Lentilactobacillus sp. TOM.63 TaxID=3055077 RepID=UPI0025A30D16|nr:hypothetical protein [Lentilactobacillus sp. TOM.63]MDM7515801.1 hypothetical protein [Lentilactobacillus sp. TOM.63]